MMTLKDLLATPNYSSPDGRHWEPSIPMLSDWNWPDAWAVLRGRALAVRQTTKADLRRAYKEDDDELAALPRPACRPDRRGAPMSSYQRVLDDVARGRMTTVWCHRCGTYRRAQFQKAMSRGWPTCCGETMSLDDPRRNDRPTGEEPTP